MRVGAASKVWSRICWSWADGLNERGARFAALLLLLLQRILSFSTAGVERKAVIG